MHTPRSVTLVCGPPCAGKTTLVSRLRAPWDTVADFDEIAARLGSPGKWMHSALTGDASEFEMRRLIATVGAMQAGRAWVIRCAPEPDVRAELAGLLRADRVVVLLPTLGELLLRARERPLASETRRAVMRWMDRYGPWTGDELMRG